MARFALSRSAISSGHFVTSCPTLSRSSSPRSFWPDAHERDAEVELPVREPVARPLPVRQLGDRLVVLLPVQESLRDQEAALRLLVDRKRSCRLAQRPVGLLVEPGRIQDLAEVVPGLVAHGLGCRRVRQQALEDFARLAMLAEREVEAAAQELRIARMRGEPALVAIGGEPHERVEMVVLVEIEQHVAVVQVLHIDGRQARDGVLLDDGRGERRGRQRRQDDEFAQHPALTPRREPRIRAGACETLSLILSSTYLAPTPFATLSVVPRL